MNNNNTLFLPILLALFFLIISIAPSQSEEPASVSCDTENATSQISTNIAFLLPNLDTQNGSKLVTYGYNESKVYGLAQCIGNVSNQACQSCIKNAIDVIHGHCPIQSGAWIWYDNCHLKYSNRSFYGESGGWADSVLVNSEKVTGFKDFNKSLTELMINTTDEALGSPNGFGSGSIKLAG
ncbi:hypothetical protein CASFOL_039694 [Castilleja foliolosa]|uniref:Gnk2-homologous domain-containing protein n=1 Tax=Castilleja foliolosa TaxID=1961234 RepID=A0ABD3BG91_9LAMI